MQQIKIFKGMENELHLLEDQVNDWLIDGQVQIISMFGNIAPQSMPAELKDTGLSKSNFAPSDVLLVVLYEKI